MADIDWNIFVIGMPYRNFISDSNLTAFQNFTRNATRIPQCLHQTGRLVFPFVIHTRDTIAMYNQLRSRITQMNDGANRI